jgi:hypothetical protein
MRCLILRHLLRAAREALIRIVHEPLPYIADSAHKCLTCWSHIRRRRTEFLKSVPQQLLGSQGSLLNASAEASTERSKHPGL